MVVLFATTYTSVAQSDSGDPTEIDYTSELVKIAKGAEAPEAAFFTKYGNTPVSLYTGTPNVSIPLYEHKGRELNLPITLVYDAQAIKVEEQASWVGLHWNLVAGGRVSRIVNGLPDDSAPSGAQRDYQTMFDTNFRNQLIRYTDVSHTYNSLEDVKRYFQFMDLANKNRSDVAQDYFSVSAPGLDEMVVIDLGDLKARSLKNPRTKVEYQGNGTINSWVITSDNGTQYIFDVQEKTYKQGNDASASGGIIQEYVSSWLLTKIISPTKKDEYEFSYTDSGYWNQPYASAPASHITNILFSNSGGSTITGGKTSTFQPLTRLSQQFLNSIKHNGNKMASFIHKQRYDIALSVPSALSSIQIHEPILSATSPGLGTLKSIMFDHTYFSTNSTNPSSLSHDDIRLKLDKVTIQGSTVKYQQKYSFEYIQPTSVPSKKSLSQDYMGYYNGASNSVLYPRVVNNGNDYQGANRAVDFDYAKVGLLQKITYPTTGYTIFEYEANTIPSRDSTEYEEREITYGSTSVSGGINPNNSGVCGPSCVDTFGGPPNISEAVFEIKEAGSYQIDYRTNGQYTATLFRHPLDNPSGKPNPIPYNQVIDPNTNQQLVPYLWSGGSSGSIRSVSLTPGYYQMTLANSFPQGSTYLRVFRRERVPVTNEDVIKAGARVRAITDYSADGVKASQKYYRYIQSLETLSSSGKVIFEPKFVYYTSRLGPFTQPITTMHRTTGSTSNQPNVVYSRVYEFETNIKSGKSLNGYTVYDFHTGEAGIITSSSRPHINSYVPDYKAGKESEASVFSNAKKIHTTQNTYSDISFYAASSLTVNVNEDNANKYVLISRDDATGKYWYSYIEGILSGAGYVPPVPCQNNPQNCLTPAVSPLELIRSIMVGKIGNMVAVRKTEVVNDKEFISLNTMNYATTGNYLLKNSTISSSDGVDRITKFYYPEDFTEPVYTSLKNSNRITEVVQAEIYEGSNKLTTRKTLLKDWGNGAIFPEVVQSSKGDAPLQDRIIYHQYDAKNNPLEVSQPEGGHTIYVWGYQDQYPVAKITNATYTGMPIEVQDIITQIKTASDTESSPSQETALKNLLKQLRDHSYFANAEVTSYTYDPQIGVTSITDPKGYTTTYEYDDLQRLKYVKDAEGKLVSRNKYHYKNQ